MHAVIRTYAAAPEVVAEARPKLADLEQTMRRLPGFVAYYFIETADGLATVTVTEDGRARGPRWSRRPPGSSRISRAPPPWAPFKLPRDRRSSPPPADPNERGAQRSRGAAGNLLIAWPAVLAFPNRPPASIRPLATTRERASPREMAQSRPSRFSTAKPNAGF